jgi:hypothetical protein
MSRHMPAKNGSHRVEFFYTLASATGELMLGTVEELDFTSVCEEALAALEAGRDEGAGEVGLYEVYRWLHDRYGVEKLEAVRYYNISTRSEVRPA